MPLLSEKEVLRQKLSTIPAPVIKSIAKNYKVKVANKAEMIKSLLDADVKKDYIDEIIKSIYTEIIEQRRNLISDDELLKEVDKVKSFNWGVVQGQLDDKIQRNYVREFFRFNELVANIESTLYSEIKNYVICTWYNHWTTVLIEDLISLHPKVVPTITNVKGVDLFFDEQPFDLKVTYLPKSYDYDAAVAKPEDLSVWMYQNQGAQRFGSENRLFVILHDPENPDRSWEIKRNLPLLKERITKFLDETTVTSNDEVAFTFNRNTFTALSKVFFITN